jgi:hypothetical protein
VVGGEDAEEKVSRVGVDGEQIVCCRDKAGRVVDVVAFPDVKQVNAIVTVALKRLVGVVNIL